MLLFDAMEKHYHHWQYETHKRVNPRGWLFYLFLISVTTAGAKRTGAAASVECRQREPARAISPE
jgi:hypothetical protein